MNSINWMMEFVLKLFFAQNFAMNVMIQSFVLNVKRDTIL